MLTKIHYHITSSQFLSYKIIQNYSVYLEQLYTRINGRWKTHLQIVLFCNAETAVLAHATIGVFLNYVLPLYPVKRAYEVLATCSSWKMSRELARYLKYLRRDLPSHAGSGKAGILKRPRESITRFRSQMSVDVVRRHSWDST